MIEVTDGLSERVIRDARFERTTDVVDTSKLLDWESRVALPSEMKVMLQLKHP